MHHACMHAYIHTCMHTYIRTYIHTYVHTYIYLYMPYLNLAAMSLSCPGETDAPTGESEWHASWDGMDADGDAMPCWDGWDNWGEHDAFPTSLNHIEGDGSNNGTWELDRGESDLDGLPCNSFSKSGWMFVPLFFVLEYLSGLQFNWY